jgi:hypothetical protein
MFSTNIGHDVPNLAPVIHKGSSRVWSSCRHFLINSLIILSRIFSFRFDSNIWANNIIQCCSSYTILRGKVIFDLIKGPWKIFVIDLRFFSSLLEANFMMLLLNYSHSRNPSCARGRTHGQIQAPREPPNYGVCSRVCTLSQYRT